MAEPESPEEVKAENFNSVGSEPDEEEKEPRVSRLLTQVHKTNHSRHQTIDMVRPPADNEISVNVSQELEKTINSESVDLPLCRICFGTDDTATNPFISPCRCMGSLKHVHHGCLRTWITRKENVRQTAYVTSYTWKAFHCELCKSELASTIENRGRAMWLFEMNKPRENYIILESTQLSTQANVAN